MNPGKELDKLIAEKVMGWKLSRMEHDPETLKELPFLADRPNPLEWFDAKGKIVARYEEDENPEYPEPVWSPSTRIEDAWEVVATFQRRGFHVDLWKVPEKLWACSFSKRRDAKDIARGDADTASHAICLAAINYLGLLR